MNRDLEMANAAISERQFGDIGAADDIERWRREIGELRRAALRALDTLIGGVSPLPRRRADYDDAIAMLKQALKGAKP